MNETGANKDVREAFALFGRDEERLRPIDILVRHRELFGYGVLSTLDALVAATLTAGPDQRHLSKPLVDDGKHMLAELTNVAAMREFCRDELGFALEASALTQAQFRSVAAPRLMNALEQLAWAREADSRALRLRINALQLLQQTGANGVVLPSVFPSSFRLRAVVTWRNVLGRELSEVHVTGPELFSAPEMMTDSGSGCFLDGGSLSGSATSNPQFQLAAGAGAAEATAPPPPPPLPRHCSFSASSLSTAANSASFEGVLFRTTCTTSCTIRVSIDTPNGLEFAHGHVRANFLPGDAAQRMLFSIPLLRPQNLSSITDAKRKASSSKSKSKSAIPTTVHSTTGDAATAQQHQAAAAQAALALGASAHQRMGQPMPAPAVASRKLNAAAVDPGVIVGTLSVEIDSIAANFSNLVATAHQIRVASGKADADDGRGDGVEGAPQKSETAGAPAVAAPHAQHTSSFRPPDVPEAGSTVAFFLKRLQEGSVERRRRHSDAAAAASAPPVATGAPSGLALQPRIKEDSSSEDDGDEGH